jgi:hypothetical protein
VCDNVQAPHPGQRAIRRMDIIRLGRVALHRRVQFPGQVSRKAR